MADDWQPTSIPHAPDVKLVLDDIFSVCRLKFVHDFVFTPDPSADISVLTSPTQSQHAVSALITISNVETTASYAHVFDFACNLNYAATPAFSVGPITLGFSTQEPATDTTNASINSLVAGPDRVLCNRYVRDDEKGIFFLISDNHHTGVTEVDCCRLLNSRKRIRVCARFTTDSFKEKLQNMNGNITPEHFASSLSYLNVAYESRICVVCGGPPTVNCGCQLPFVCPSHPLDFSVQKKNMAVHTGYFEGASTARLFNNAKPFVLATLASKSAIMGTIDQDVIQRLSRYAVQIRMRQLSLSPLSSSVIQSHLLLPGALLQTCHEEQPVSSPIENVSPDVVEFDAVTLEGVALDTAKRINEYPALPTISSGGLLDDISLPLVDEAVEEVLSSANGSTIDSNERTASLSSDASASVTPQSNNTQMNCIANMERPADAPKAPTSRELKAELRKQRNREAAAKSNIKRKLRNEALRRDLKEIVEKATELRAVERRLREENVKLRLLASEKNIRVSSHLRHIQIVQS